MIKHGQTEKLYTNSEDVSYTKRAGGRKEKTWIGEQYILNVIYYKVWGGKVARVHRYLYMCPLDYAK
jgi:hypothetical protein